MLVFFSFGNVMSCDAESITTKALRKMRVPKASLQELETDLQEAEQAVLSRFAADSAAGGGELYSTMPALSDSGKPNTLPCYCLLFSCLQLTEHVTHKHSMLSRHWSFWTHLAERPYFQGSHVPDPTLLARCWLLQH